MMLTKEILKTGGTFQMFRLTNFILTKLLMNKIGIRKEVWLQRNSTNLSVISGLGIVYWGSTAIHSSLSASLIINIAKFWLLEFLYRKMHLPMLWRTASRIWMKVMGKSWALGCYASKWNQSIISCHHNNLENVDLGSFVFLFGQISWSSVDSLHSPLKAELLLSVHWRISLLGINLCGSLTSCIKTACKESRVR